jgi:hypothetical protein
VTPHPLGGGQFSGETFDSVIGKILRRARYAVAVRA